MQPVPLHTKPLLQPLSFTSPLPSLLQTPSGLAIVEVQGTINTPPPEAGETSADVGRLVFPNYRADDATHSSDWQKTVHLYVGKHQRLTGEVRKLPNPLAILRKREQSDGGGEADELEIAEIVHYKIIFSHRPEPVGDDT